MFNNIGQKIKAFAQIAFFVETIASIITGLVLWFESEEITFALIILGGPVIALVSSWFIYGFGEIIELLTSIEQKMKAQKDQKEPMKIFNINPDASEKPKTPGNTQVSKPENKQTPDANVPYWCGNCKYNGPYEGNCPSCGSSIKRYNTFSD